MDSREHYNSRGWEYLGTDRWTCGNCGATVDGLVLDKHEEWHTTLVEAIREQVEEVENEKPVADDSLDNLLAQIRILALFGTGCTHEGRRHKDTHPSDGSSSYYLADRLRAIRALVEKEIGIY